MKLPAIALLCFLLAGPAFASEREVKQQLVAELLEVIDAKALTQATFDIVFEHAGTQASALPDGEERSPELEAAQKEQLEMMRAFRERLYSRIDYAKYATEVYAPLFEKHFNAAELRELIAFYKTKVGQKSVTLLPDLALGGMVKGAALLQEAVTQTSAEMEKEQAQKHPEKGTMADMRTLATALEARATDENSYPDVDLQGLKPLLEPTYIRQMPEKDAWGTPFLYVSNGKQYRIVSAGADKRFEWSARQFTPDGAEPRATDDPDADLVFQDGLFTQYPRKTGLRQH